MRVLVASLFLLAARAQPPQEDAVLERLLERAAGAARRFVTEFQSYACNERVLQVKYGQGDHIDARQEEVYDYLLLISDDGGIRFEESRISKQRPAKTPQRPLLVTTGFAVLSVIFHEQFQPGYRFRRLGPEARGGRMLEKVTFEALPGGASPSVLEAGGRQYVLEWRGSAWLDPGTGAVARIEVELMRALDDIGLAALRAEVEFLPVGGSTEVWAPREAVIEARTRRQRWRNVHEFSGYRKFDVQTEQKIGEVKR